MASNNLIANQMIANMIVPIWKNSNAFINNIDTQYSDEFANTGAQIGNNIRIRYPLDYTIRVGPTASVQATNEKFTTLQILETGQAGVDMGFTSYQRTLYIEDFRERYIVPAVNRTVGYVAQTVMASTEGGASGWAANYDNAGVLLQPIQNTWLSARASLLNNSAPMTGAFKIVVSPDAEAATVATLSGLFNNQTQLGKQYMSGQMFNALGFDWMADQTVILHTTGTLKSSTPTYTAGKGFAFTTVSGANQSGNAITVAALTGTLSKGDIICYDGSYAVNRVTKQAQSGLQTFTVTADVASGATSIPIRPALTPPLAGSEVQYQTVTASPTASGNVYCKTQQNVVYQKNLAFHPKAITLAMADLVDMPNADVARTAQDGVAARVLTQGQGITDSVLTRLDVLFGQEVLRSEWMCVVPSPPPA